MIHHISIPAADPRHVAHVLGELLGGHVGPFVGPIPGAWVAYADDEHGTGVEVYPDRTELVPMMARWMARAGREVIDECDVVVPVPLHRWRLFSRRFNQAADLARALAAETGKPMLANALRRKRRTAQQVGLGKAAREANMKGAFEVTLEGKAELFGTNVLLIDDVYTTGATVSAATRALKRAGVAKVDVLTFAMAFARPDAGII